MKRATRVSLLTRLERLESNAAATQHPLKVRFGHLKRLPPEYKGERHVIVARELPKQGDQEWVEFEEVPGPNPNPPQCRTRGTPDRLDVMLVRAYPQPEETVGQ
jgi:hypothetical protein